MSVHPLTVDGESPFFGESCALCKETFRAGDEIVICPEDATRHHTQCWVLNGNACTAYGCQGSGVIVTTEFIERRQGPRPAGGRRGRNRAQERIVYRSADGRSKVQVMPDRSFSCAQGCFLLMVGAAILMLAMGCFGLWAIFDYLMIDVFNLPYREPISSATQMLPLYLSLF